MDAIENIKTRRSIRKYKAQRIPDELITEILKSGMQAPSAGNQQPWHFIVIDKKDIFQDIMNIHPHSKMLNEASHAILILADLKLEKYVNYWSLDCSACTQNILLSAHSLGLGAVWLGIYPREERMNPISELFNLPENIKPFSMIALGYANEEKGFEDRFKNERIHVNKF